MTQQDPDVLDRLLRANDLGWMIDMYGPRDQAIPFLIDQLHRVAERYQSRVGVHVSFAPETLEHESAHNPHKVRAFLQALGCTRSPDMLVMVWRVLQGLSIREVNMTYRERDTFDLRVVLARPGDAGDQLEDYSTQDINDASLFRHFGIATVSGRPLFDGFFPLRLGG
jgi:hypothetical protein